MHTLIVAAAFLTMLLMPCLVTIGGSAGNKSN